jgi:deazaflavin-dependent oxidoreductase (nitroreductase family)
MTQEIHDNPTDWVNKHIRQYVETDGKRGGRFYGHDALLITTRGRKSGMRRRTALYYGVDGDRYVLVASNGGSKGHPNWYLNLAADPAAEVQIGGEKFSARARTATGDERTRLWQLMAAIFPTYNQYQAKAKREIPVVVLERA